MSFPVRNVLHCSTKQPGVEGGQSHYDTFRSFWDDGVIESLQDAHAVADTAGNGILLRSDIHLFFDAYQFAFLVPLVSESVL
jgi:HNH endonuclease